MSSPPYKDTTVILVQAAWADGSSWNKVIPQLRQLDLQVVSAQIPLTSLTDDVAACPTNAWQGQWAYSPRGPLLRRRGN